MSTYRMSFRPLSGFLYSLLIDNMNVRKAPSKFPSPLGVSLFSMKHRRQAANRVRFPSPLGVSLFSIKSGKNVYIPDEFPSPLGVSLFSIELQKYHVKKINCFRPLSGFLYSLYCRLVLKIHSMLVSVPSRGFFILYEYEDLEEQGRLVSVPSRGFFILYTASGIPYGI